MEEQRSLSLRLYEVLENIGASEKMRKLHKRTYNAWEILCTVRCTLIEDKLIHCYACGSTYEGSVTPDLSSDKDVIVCYISPPVVLDQHASTHEKSLLMVINTWTYPGYCKLQVMLNGHPLTGYDVRPNEEDVDEVGRICRRHFRIDNMDGPANKTMNNEGVHVLDYVPAYKCNNVPLFASNRLDTLKKRKVITDEEFVKLQRMGCMFVGAGYFMSPEKGIEWRLSLSLQERHLMSKLNPTQHKVYILLKIFKKNMEKALGCNVLTSYHCKTCVLHAVEMTARRSWTPGNLIKCLMQCIKLMIRLLRNNYCPNYFNRDQNLFSKEGFSKFREPLLHMMELLVQSNNLILTLIQTDHVGHILLEGEWKWRNDVEMKKAEVRFDIQVFINYRIVRSFPVLIYKLCGGQNNITSLVSALHTLQQTYTITEHTATETQSALNYIYPWFHLHVAKALACLSYRYQDRTYRKQMLKTADVHFSKAEFTDLVNVRLAQATVLYKSEQYEMCYWLLRQIENDFTYKVIRMCPCTPLHSVMCHSEQDKRDREQTLSGMSVRKVLKCFYACCVVFLPSQFQLVPSPLQYEMFRSVGTRPRSRNEHKDFWFDWCVIDAKVYLYIMQYLVSTKLQKEVYKQVAMDNIRAVIEEDNALVLRQYGARQLGHRETAYNLLGWIYMQEQRNGDAMHCFLKSWKIRPFHNAAKFHMRDLIAKLSERQRQGTA